ncbi:activator of HSP90 ATPase [Paractinoplanes rishiriensis]|nr:activator of HSP90 ATPase [Actinoplanes rishiriensis]
MTDHRGLKPYDVEVSLPTGRDTVWQAVTQPPLLHQWFGWEYDGLDAEIRQLFVDEATMWAPERMGWADGSFLEVTGDDDQATVRVHREGSGPSGPERYDAIEEAWRAFLTQLRFLLERAPTGRRRTLYLTGLTTGPKALALATTDWDRFGPRTASTVDPAGHLLVVSSRAPLTTKSPARTELIVTTYGLDDDAFDALQKDWTNRWSPIATNAETTTATDPAPDN